ncbi:synaptotagmin-like protein 2 isoform X13 [Melanotaenia boesemani]|uniref:synaptotagmin-like protein 2 isoform X13 n=1 Tax=Melanotaenia boesemani TaxID=1250792 RepID=UPI001C04826C|nr:synaptotagmin-like protein 2 isoform X13 [Melanotaenia boesemani]
MIDLSFLTDEEQEAILTVLRRDAELKKTEEQRVLNLQKSVADKSQLKYLSGEWFYETKQLRHQDRIHGSDIIRAAMKHTLKPLTIMEIAHILPERSSFMSSENKEVFVPPELRGLLQEPNVQLRDGCQIFSPHETVQETPKADVRSPTKRKNPFNSELVCEEKDGQSLVRAADQAQRQNESFGESSSPIISTLKRLASMSISSSKSLENLTSQTAASTITNLKPMKPSLSVPLLQQNETDSTFETNLGHKRNNSSSMSNMTLSSGMASMSSISSSVSSLHPPDCGDVDIQGSIQFAVNYIQKLGEFHIFVVLVRGLAVADTKKNRSDPYVKCYLLPDKTKLGKRKTTVKKRTLNPTYNEVLRFKIKLEELKTQKLNISVWHNDTFGRNSFLGEVDLDLFQWDFSNTQINEYTLKARVSEPASAPAPSHIVEERGQMRVALRFLLQTPNSKGASRMETGEVQIWVKDCKNLPPVGGIIINPFVKCTVLPDMSFKSRQKTRVVKRTASPMFNHIMVYDGFRSEDLKEACVEITVWDHDRLKNQYVGGLRLGLGTGKSYGVDVFWMDSTRNETDLWQRMLQSDGEWVEDVLPLRMIVTAKSMSK